MKMLQKIVLGLFLFLAGLSAHALDLRTIPEVLKPWIPWVLQDQPQFDCPFFYQDFQQKRCSWPGMLSLDLLPNQGHFSIEGHLYQADWLILPGDNQHWPQQVVANGKPVVVTDYQGKPAVWLEAGQYQLGGVFLWDRLPESLAIAADTGLLELTLDHQLIHHPQIDQGAVWLKTKAFQEPAVAVDSLDLQVFRLVLDDNPLQLITRLELDISGKAREISLTHALLPTFIPFKLDSALPARMEKDGRLVLQVRPGHWSVSLHARMAETRSQLDFSPNDPAWPEAEIWSFQAVPALRLVEIENLPAIDASQTNIPQEWAHFPAYRIAQGQSMGFKLIRRGDAEPEPNQLSLKRRLWLDFAGSGYSVSDSINGKMTRDWRINALPETHLGQVLLNGQNQLITQASDQQQGIEVRRCDMNLQADSRIQADIYHLNAVGWQQTFKQVQAELNIPPGWRLLAVGGVDNEPDCWLTRWTLLDFFLVLMAALATARLWRWPWGLAALIGLVLFWHELDAPRWVWLNCLAAQALVNIWPNNRFLLWIRAYRYLCWLSLVLIAIPFMVQQMRVGIYPQLEKPWQSIQTEAYNDSLSSGAGRAGSMMMEMPAAPTPRMEEGVALYKSYSAVADSADSAVNYDRMDPEANLQTGPGLPQWQWHTVMLSWNGAVDNRQQIRFWYLPPGLNLILHILQVLAVALIGLKITGVLDCLPPVSWKNLKICLLLPFLLLPGQDGMAEMPDQALLDQLKSRLLQTPACFPGCAAIASMQLHSNTTEMRIELEVHARENVALPLPAQLHQWYPERVSVDDKPARAIIRTDDGRLWLALNQGVHQVRLSGRHGDHSSFNLPLPLLPQHSTLNLDGWQVEGIYEDGKTADPLQFTRLNSQGRSGQPVFQSGALPAFVRVERTLHLGLDWRVSTRVVRVEQNENPVVLKIPLLAGEAVTSDQIRVENGQVLVNMASGVAEQVWQSVLEKSDRLELKVGEAIQWSEVWRVDVSPVWHLETQGIAVVHHQDLQGSWLPEWRPWPGEAVQIFISRPEAVPGNTLTIDKSQLRIEPGKRNQSVEMNLHLRSSKGGQHTLLLPPQAELQSVSIDSVLQPIRQNGNTVTLPLRPGAQQWTLNWQSSSVASMILKSPVVNLGVASVNSHIQLIPPQDRWLLFTLGPDFGPAVLFWGFLIILLLLAIGLGRIRLTPLKTWHWFLLLIGLSQLHIAAAVFLVLWLLALGIRGRQTIQGIKFFNLCQIGLGLGTIFAILSLFAAVKQGLLGAPDMQIAGNQSTTWDLKWYQDQSPPELPTASVLSVPIMVYRVIMLAWSFWMAMALLDWLRWGWRCFSSGDLWRKKPITVNNPDKNIEAI